MRARRYILRRIASARALTGHHRSDGADLTLATLLAGVAGAANAGGFLALGEYASHMTGHLSQMADNLITGDLRVVVVALIAVASFVAGAALTAVLINWARRRHIDRQYALPIAVQGWLLACLAGTELLGGEWRRVTALGFLCFIMGMQNATITKISGARIRTTHATGMITDIGIELGRELYGRVFGSRRIAADRVKLGIHLRLVGAFVAGGVLGALGFSRFGLGFGLPLAVPLLALSLPALLDRPARS